MVKSRTEVIIAISDNDNVAEKTKFLLFFMTCFHFVFLLELLVAGGYGVNTVLNLTDKQLKEPLIMMMKKYLPLYGTNWNVTFQTTFLCLALVHDVLQWLDKHESKLGKKIKYFRDIIFNGLVFPFTCFVTGMFWCVYLIDRELVFPQVYDQIVPWWLNHCVHTNIFIVIAIETILTRRRHPTDAKVERCLWIFVSVFYAVVYYSIFFFGGCWLYGVFGVMTWWQVCLYQAGIWFSTWVFYRMAFIINSFIHKEEDPAIAPKNVKVTNGDFESKETVIDNTKNGNVKNVATLVIANDSNKLVNDVNTNVTKDYKGHNGDSVNDNTESPNNNGNIENGKEWKSLGRTSILEEEEHGNLDQPFDKSWSNKYRTNRAQFEKASL